jgi:hypothetical protein
LEIAERLGSTINSVPLAVVMLDRSGANLVAPSRLGLPEDDREWGRRLPSLAAIGWSFVFDGLDYGRLWGQRPGVVGHTCKSALLVRSLLALTPRCPFSLAEVGSGAGRPGPRWLTSVGVGPGRVNGG